MARYSEFSFTSLWARIGDAADSAMTTSGQAPRGVVVDLLDEERAVLASRIAPFVAELEQLRLGTLATVDRRARMLVPLAVGGTFIAMLLTGQRLYVTLLFGLLAAMVGWFVAMGNRSGDYQSAVKSRFTSVISEYLSGFDHVVNPKTDLMRLHDWKLFPDLQSARTLDRITGQRDGRSVSISEMEIAYAPSELKRNMSHHTLNLSVIEVTSGAVEIGLLLLIPTDAPPRLLTEQESALNPSAALAGQADIDAAYAMRVSDPSAVPMLTTEMRSAILALAEAGPAGRPYLVFMPGCLIALFPTQLADLTFHVPPYWVPIDADALLAQFASDLALKSSLLDAVLALPDRATTT